MINYYLDKLLDKYSMRTGTYFKVMYAVMTLIIIGWFIVGIVALTRFFNA